MKKILIAPNSFKGSAHSVSAARLFKKYLPQFLPPDKYEFITKPVSDGGDGFLKVCENNFELVTIPFAVSTPYSEDKLKTEFGYSAASKTVYIESANILGLEIIPKRERRQLKLSSKGIGELLLHLKKIKEEGKFEIEKVVVGIGGTGTSDLGIGCAGVFGLKLSDEKNNLLKLIPENFAKAGKINLPKINLPFDIETVTDVDNPLTGERGAAKVFAKQKGASPEEINIIEKGFIRILNLMNFSDGEITKLSGAGGGLAAGLNIFFGAKSKSSKNFILEDLGINKKNINVQAVVTGEGSFDVQSLMDKGASVIINEFKNSGAEIFLCAGIIKDDFEKEKFKDVYFLELKKYFSNEDESIKNIEKGILLASDEIARIIN